MGVNDVLEYYGQKGLLSRLKYYILFIWRFILDKIIFFVFIKELRTILHRLRGVRIGKGVYIGHEVMFDRVYTDQIEIGDYTSVGDRCIINAHANIPSKTPLTSRYPRTVLPTKIGIGVWLMPNVTIAPGVTIGDFSVIATGSVVTKDIPPKCLAAGVPAKVVKEFEESLEIDNQTFKSYKFEILLLLTSLMIGLIYYVYAL